jgi:hypothetical protein
MDTQKISMKYKVRICVSVRSGIVSIEKLMSDMMMITWMTISNSRPDRVELSSTTTFKR